jgi:hypothetical protein
MKTEQPESQLQSEQEQRKINKQNKKQENLYHLKSNNNTSINTDQSYHYVKSKRHIFTINKN